MSKRFPTQVFEDININEFEKHNKTNVSEDFVSENFKDLGWSCFRPYLDIGVDLVARKEVCPKNHTEWDTIEKQAQCSECGSTLITITRFIQIKTRETKGDSNNTIGYTLDTTDIRADPRHTILIFSDADDGDFIICPMFDYLKFFITHKQAGQSHFGVPSFRYENMKINSLKKNRSKNTFAWSYGKGKANKLVPFDNFVNEKGVKNLANPDYDQKFDYYSQKIGNMRYKLFHNYSKGEELDKVYTINKEVDSKTTKEKQKKKREKEEKNIRVILSKKSPKKVIEIRRKDRKKFLKKCKDNPELIESVNNYFVRFKGVPQLEP